MRLKNNYFFTIREDVKDEESKSGNLLVRSGMIKKTSSGIYMFLPLGFKVLENIKEIIREEMNKTGALELTMPLLINEEYLAKTGRINSFGEEMFSLKDRANKKYVLGPTHEELFTVAASLSVKSYKDLPFNIYQIGTKFRDERRPRYGLIRVREFLMKDAYSFDTDLESLDISYNKMYKAYEKIFKRVNLDYVVVTSDTGAMGGLLSEEFQTLADIGEDTVVTCECGYNSNLEIATSYFKEEKNKEDKLNKQLIKTPNTKTIDEVSNFLNIEKSKILKTLIYKTKENFVMVLLRGEDKINEDKLSKYLKDEIELASEEEVKALTNASVGFIGPLDINIKIIADLNVKNMINFTVGANKIDHHYINVNLEDFKINDFTDLREVKQNDLCPKCKKPLKLRKSIEAANIFKLGTKYSEAFNLNYIDKDNKIKPVVMGCYGIGVGRIMASIVEQRSDENGIVWPYEVAPYKVSVVIVNTKDETQVKLANKICEDLINKNIEVLLDDREERVGVKFKDMDLIGIPIRITVGKKANENIVEFKQRTKKEFEEINSENILEKIEEISCKVL